MDTSTKLELPVEGRLPSLEGATGWLNTEPLTTESLRGRPVLVEFWTFTCINWLRTLPYVRAWYERYRDDGLVVIGVHSPEFGFEHDLRNIRTALDAMDVVHPIAVDNDFAVWRAFDNAYWPALYLVDVEGRIRYHRFGEGEYEASELVIQQLLAYAGARDVDRELTPVDAQGVEAQADWDDLRSLETYIGYERTADFAGLVGDWTVERQDARLNAAGGRIAQRFHARDLNLVMGSGEDDKPVRFRVSLDGRPPGADHGVDTDEQGQGTVAEPRLYQLVRQRGPIADRTFEIEFMDPGVRAYVFTFG
jgi:thiol-disulfide isomerase/thioredoxin